MFNESIAAILLQLGKVIDSFGRNLEREVAIPCVPPGKILSLQKLLDADRKI